MRIGHALPVLPPQPPTPSAEVLALRTNWKWAYLSHFLFTYNPMLHLEDIQLSELEDDLANGTFQVIPTVMQRLLTSLTPHDKRSILENWQHHLRKQSLRRAPDHNVMGTEDDPVDFSSLIMTDKLHILQSLCEWQFHNPNNLRTRMKDDDDYANWRIEPIAYDAKFNAYWLMGGNRLWIQHAPSRKRNAGSHKRKQPATSAVNNRKTTKRGPAAAASSKLVAAPSKSKPTAASSSSGRPTRTTRSRQTPTESLTMQNPRIIGTRVSTRLRRREEEEVWQPIPEEWLKEGSSEDIDAHQQLNGKQKENGAEMKDALLNPLDDVSELTSLSELSDVEEDKERSEDVGDAEDEDEDKVQDSPPSESSDLSSSKEDKWETVCVTLAEWEAFPQRFEKSTHRREKDFYKLLINDLVPMITEVLRVDVRKKHMEEAVVHRKRSSRIAVKESVREAERAEARRKAEEEKEMERHRRWEARARKEEDERLRREALRSARLREKAMEENESVDVDIVDGEPENKPQASNGNAWPIPLPAGTPAKFVVNGSKTTTQAPKDDEPWELDCEICRKRGTNLDDGLELMSCERCNKWQHIRCHDQADFIAGRPPRDWEVVDFLCAACSTSGVSVAQQPQSHGYPQGQTLGHYNGAAANTSSSGSIRPQFQKPLDHRTVQQIRSGSKPQTALSAMPYNNGRTGYTAPKQQYPQPAAPLYVQRQPSAVPSGTATYPTSAAQSHASAAMPYTSTPNLYLSNATSNYRSLQHAHKATVQPQTQPSLAHYQGHTAVAPASAGTWTQQQAQYSNLAAWSTATSAPPHSGPVAAQLYEHPQHNGYYRSHVAMQSSPLVQPQVAPTQRYHSGGPQS